MLDREKLAHDIFSLVSKLFPDLGSENDLARKTWQEIAATDDFAARVEAAQSSFLIPFWDGNLTDTFSIPSIDESHTVLAVDGSQIYPDRHVAGAGCFLLNTGGVKLSYGAKSSAEFFSQPYVLLPDNLIEGIKDVSFSRDLVDLKREEFELAATVERALGCDEPPICFVDGSIIFWQLEAKHPDVKSFFLNKYLFYLDQLYKNKILVAGYISMSKSKELVNLIKLGLCRFTVADCIRCHHQFAPQVEESHDFPCKQVDRLLDTHVARFFLKPRHRTTVFYSNSKIVESYPEHPAGGFNPLRPAFVYCDVGAEIVRLEVPAWIAKDKDALDRVCAVAIDQATKGNGYPVALAEAHEQAVVKGGDREFFYHLLYKIGLNHKKRIRYSEKSMKKRRMGV